PDVPIDDALRPSIALDHVPQVAPDLPEPAEEAGMADQPEPLPESAARYGLSHRLAATECASTPSTRAAKRGASGVTPTGMGLYTTRQRGDHAQDHYRHRRHAAAADPEGRGGRVPLHDPRPRGDRAL